MLRLPTVAVNIKGCNFAKNLKICPLLTHVSPHCLHQSQCILLNISFEIDCILLNNINSSSFNFQLIDCIGTDAMNKKDLISTKKLPYLQLDQMNDHVSLQTNDRRSEMSNISFMISRLYCVMERSKFTGNFFLSDPFDEHIL